jgi:uncharacterized protein (DUF302 family)
MKYYFEKTLNADFETTVETTKEALKAEGFGVLSEIDIHDKLKEKLDIDFRKYKILGACNPPFAYEALQEEDKIGIMLPCNVIIQEFGKNKVQVAAVDPVASMVAIDNPKLMDIAGKIQEKLKLVIDKLK